MLSEALVRAIQSRVSRRRLHSRRCKLSLKCVFWYRSANRTTKLFDFLQAFDAYKKLPTSSKLYVPLASVISEVGGLMGQSLNLGDYRKILSVFIRRYYSSRVYCVHLLPITWLSARHRVVFCISRKFVQWMHFDKMSCTHMKVIYTCFKQIYHRSYFAFVCYGAELIRRNEWSFVKLTGKCWLPDMECFTWKKDGWTDNTSAVASSFCSPSKCLQERPLVVVSKNKISTLWHIPRPNGLHNKIS